MRMRILILPISALVIAGLCAWRLTRPTGPPPDTSRPAILQPAPLFETLDSDNQLVRLQTYYGRHRILLAFYDGESGPDRDPVLRRLRDEYDRLDDRGIVVLGISRALPQRNRAAEERGGAFPFPLLSDVTDEIHESWGRSGENSQGTLPGLFLIDRAGRVAWSQNGPEPLAAPQTTIDALLADD